MALNEVPRHRRQLTDEVASQLRQSIMAGDLAPGESVRPEAVGSALDVSATPVREALHILRAEGFLDLMPRRGFAVARLSGDDIRDIFEAHALVAGELAARAARCADERQIAELQVIHAGLKAAVAAGSTEQLERRNHEFHRRLYEIAGSERLRWALGGFVKYVPRAFYARVDGWPQTSAADHTEVLDAVAAHRPDAAREAMERHIRHAGEHLAASFESGRTAGGKT